MNVGSVILVSKKVSLGCGDEQKAVRDSFPEDVIPSEGFRKSSY
jgi:hypothetical protein